MLLSEPPQTPYDVRFSLLGIAVRIHPFFWLVAILLGSNGKADLAQLLIWTTALLISVLVHEMGHALTAEMYGRRSWITLYGMGGLATHHPPLGLSWRLIHVILNGPLAGFVFCAMILMLVKLTGHDVRFALGGPLGFRFGFELANPRLEELVFDLIWINLFWGIVNLLPVYPLDGGQIARVLFLFQNHREGHRRSLMLSIVCAIVVAVYAATRLHSMMIPCLFGMMAYDNFQHLQLLNHRY